MFTQAPEITVDATVGQVIVQPTATPTATSTSESTSSSTTSSTATPTPTLTPTPTPTYSYPTSAPIKRFRQNALSIYGYGAINSEVTLRGFGVSEKTTTDSTGLFRFSEIYSFTYAYPELCIQLKDSENRVTQPTCIPALPNNSTIPLEVGPILLSPTISLNRNRLVVGEDGYLSGKTTPNTKVNIYLSKNTSKSLISLVTTVDAYNLPIVDSMSNEKGEFNINMPTSDTAQYKVFASTKFGDNFSAKSNTLQFNVISSVKSFWQTVLDFILKNKIMMVVIAEVLVLMFLFIITLNSTTKRHSKHTEKDYLDFVTGN
jgi:hypothetical protein